MKTKKIIGVIGAQNVGKTTLINALKETKLFNNYDVYPSIVRSLVPLGFDFHQVDDTLQLLVLQKQTEYLLHAYHTKSKVLLDRTVIDNLAYINYYKKLDSENYHVSNVIYNYIKKETENLIIFYDMLIYIEPEFPMTSDGTRIISWKQQEFVSNEIQRLIADTWYPLTKICKVSGSVDSRVNQVIKFYDTIN
jgi:nicotinamide riboside kinase